MSDTGREPSVEAAPERTDEHAANGRGPERVIEIQRRRMLAAMAEVCAERGVGNVTVAHVVSHSGVSRRTFYEIFDDRDACFLATAEEALANVASYVLPAYRTPMRWHERMRAGLVALLKFLEDEPFIGHLLVVDTLGAGPRALERRRQVVAQLVAAVDEGRDEAKPGNDPPPLTAEGLVGGLLSVLHSQLLERHDRSLVDIAGSLMSMIVLPYRGRAAARRELTRPVPARVLAARPTPAYPLRDVEMRLTYRTVRVLTAIAERSGSSNREIGFAAGVADQGQISKLLNRLYRLGLIENTSASYMRGTPNAWTLTNKGLEVQRSVAPRDPTAR